MANNDPWAEFTPYAPPAQKAADPWADFAPYETNVAKDIAKAAPTGVAKGAAGVLGIPGALNSLAGWATSGGGRIISDEEAARRDKAQEDNSIVGRVGIPSRVGPEKILNYETVKKAIEWLAAKGGEALGATGKAGEFGSPENKLYEAQTRPGKFVETGLEFATSALAGPGGRLNNMVRYGVVPGVVSETAGQLTEGTPYEKWARLGGALAGGGASALASRPSSAGSIVTQATEGMTAAQIAATEQLFQEAASIGVPITRAEAAQAVTNGATRLADLQRVIEGNGALKGEMAARPAQIEAAGRAAMDRLAPVPQNPSQIGPAAGEAASGIIGDTQAAINAQTRPLYNQVEQARVGAPVSQALAADPLYAETLREIRGNPALNRPIAHLPDDSAAVLDLVQRRLRERAENARAPGEASTSNLAASSYEDARTAPIAAAETATGSRAATPTAPPVVGAYEAARAEQANLREQYLAPLTQGPIGKLAKNDLTTQQAIEALFPRNPLPNSAGEVLDAVTGLAARNPWAAQQLVRAHVESVFNQATRNLQAGPSQFGGASFAAALRGNPQQAANLAASIQGLYGPQALEGFDRLLRVMEATGQRQRIGSQTAFNIEVNKELSKGGTIQAAVADASSAGLNIPARFRETLRRWNMGRNSEEIAHILTDPQGAETFRRLASAPVGSAQAGVLIGRLATIGNQVSIGKSQKAERQ